MHLSYPLTTNAKHKNILHQILHNRNLFNETDIPYYPTETLLKLKVIASWTRNFVSPSFPHCIYPHASTAVSVTREKKKDKGLAVMLRRQTTTSSFKIVNASCSKTSATAVRDGNLLEMLAFHFDYNDRRTRVQYWMPKGLRWRRKS